MSQFIMVGCDLHDRSMLIRYAVDTGEPQQLSFDNTAAGRLQMIGRLKSLSKTTRFGKDPVCL
jgi:transposase